MYNVKGCKYNKYSLGYGHKGRFEVTIPRDEFPCSLPYICFTLDKNPPFGFGLDAMLDEDSHDSQYGWFDSIKSLKIMRKKQVHYADNTYLRRLKKCEYRQEIGNCLICLDFLSEAVFQISILSRFTHENKRRKSHSNVFVYVISEN